MWNETGTPFKKTGKITIVVKHVYINTGDGKPIEISIYPLKSHTTPQPLFIGKLCVPVCVHVR